MKSITPLELFKLARQGQPIDLIDVRTPAEFQEVHAEAAVSAPLDSLDPASLLQARKTPNQPLYLICRSGGRSQRAGDLFVAAGFADVVNVDGGTLAWLESGLPVVWGQPDAAAAPGASGGCGCGKAGCRSKNA